MRLPRLLLLLAAFSLFLTACDSSDDDEPDVVAANSTVTVDYEGRLEDGTVFDEGENVRFSLRNNVISGFRDGLIGMRVGEQREFSIPPEEAYGEEGRTDDDANVIIPPNATLIFDVTLRDIQ